jgi:predicted transcriptional regulator
VDFGNPDPSITDNSAIPSVDQYDGCKMADLDTRRMLELTAQIVSAHVRKNEVPVEGLAKLINAVHAALSGATSPPVEPEKLEPAVPIKKSVFPDYVVCLEDGKKLKMLKRHLRTSYGMTPVEYRERWGLPADYPMVAPNYAARRSALAKEIGLGRAVAEQVAEKPSRRRRA